MTFDASERRRSEKKPLLQALLNAGADVSNPQNMCCPFHDDSNPSSGIYQAGNDPTWRFKCHSCGVWGDVFDIEAITTGRDRNQLMHEYEVEKAHHAANSNGKKTIADAYSKKKKPTFNTARESFEDLQRKHGKAAATWRYDNADGEPVGLVVRFDREDGSKVVLPVSKQSDGQWSNTAMPKPRPLYRLPELRRLPIGSMIYVVEGEKCADRMTALGFNATTSAGGSKAAKHADWAPLAGMKVVILPDNDAPGKRYAEDVVDIALKAGALSVRIARLSEHWHDLQTGGDIDDVVDDDDEIHAAIGELTKHAEEVGTRQGSDDETKHRAIMICAADLHIESIKWLWPRRIALGTLTLLTGDPDKGKSLLTLDIASAVTNGGGFVDCPDFVAEPADVVLLSAEDDPTRTILPRLAAAGADLNRIQILKGIEARDETGERIVDLFDLAADIRHLRKAVDSLSNCRLVVVDPISAYTGMKVDTHKTSDVRRVLMQLAAFAEETQIAIIGVQHLRKSEGAAIYRSSGSLAYIAAARAAWAIIDDPDATDKNRKLFLRIKNNLSNQKTGLAYTIEQRAITEFPFIRWDETPIEEEVDEIMARSKNKPGPEPRLKNAAMDWLEQALADGPRQANELKKEGREAHMFSESTIRRARESLEIEAYHPNKQGPWWWKIGSHDHHSLRHEQLEQHEQVPKGNTLPNTTKHLTYQSDVIVAQVAHAVGNDEHVVKSQSKTKNEPIAREKQPDTLTNDTQLDDDFCPF